MVKRNNIKRNKKNNFSDGRFWILFSIFLALFLLGLFLNFDSRLVSSYSLEVNFEITENLGVNLSDSTLSFGATPPGTIISRNVMIENNEDYEIFVYVSSSENLNNFLIFDDSFTIKSKEKKEASFTLKIPSEATFKKHSGTIYFNIYKSGFLNKWK